MPIMRTLLAAMLVATPLAAQTGSVSGTVRDETGNAIPRVAVALRGSGLSTATDANGRFALSTVPAGDWVLEVRALGFAPVDSVIRVGASDGLNLSVTLTRRVLDLGSIVVEGASRRPEEVLEAPAAVAVAPREALRAAALTGETPQALREVPGVDVVQSDLFDYNINARGFNSTLNRSILVLVDGRDIAVPFLGSQEWAGVSFSPEDLEQVEFVRGPGSALYGANAFNGVVRITTPTSREALGTRLTTGGGSRDAFRADLRHGALLAGGRAAFRVSGGYSRALGWTESRTRFDATDFAAEYAPATSDSVIPPPPGYELAPLNGQAIDPTTGAASGEPDPVITYYGSGRVDVYGRRGTLTLDGGNAHIANEVFMTGIGRFQVGSATRPWMRAQYASDGVTASAWYSGRQAQQPQRLLSANQPVDDHSAIWQTEVQLRQAFGSTAHAILGGTARLQQVNTNGTLMEPQDDNRTDGYYALFGQLDVRPAERLRIIADARLDAGDLFRAQFSPRAAAIFRLGAEHALRLSISRAFLTPSQIEYFLSGTAGTQDLTLLEEGLRGSQLGPILAGVPDGTLFSNTSAVPVLVRGNRNLQPERILSLELGYKGHPLTPLFLTVDAFYSRRTDFVTSLLPATTWNPDYPLWTAPNEVGAAFQPVVAGAVRQALAGTLAQYALTRLPDGTTAIVLSYGNAGLAHDYGVETGASLWLARSLRLDASATWYGFDVQQQALGDTLVPNTPRLKGAVGLSYEGNQGLDLSVNVHGQERFAWRSGVYRGDIPAFEVMDVTAGWQLTPLIRLHATGINVTDKKHFEAFGGAVTGRRILGGVTATF